MKKRMLALSTAVLLTAGLFAGCGAKQETVVNSEKAVSGSSGAAQESSAAEKNSEATSSKASEVTPSASGDLAAYKFCGDIVGQGVPALDDLVDEENYVFQALNSQFQIFNDNFTADTQGTNVQTMASSGYDGMMIFGWNATLYSTINDISGQTKVPYVIFDQIPQDEKVEKQLEENEYYAGAVGVDNYSGAGACAKEMWDAGIKEVLLLGGSVGDVVHDSRENGFTDAFQDLGGEILGVARCSDPSEATTKMDDLLTSHPDAQGVYCFTGDYGISALSALDNYPDVDCKIYSSDTTAEEIPYILDGSIVRGDSGSKIACILAATLLYNYVNGNRIVDEEGNAPWLNNIVSFPVTAENAQEYADKFLSGHPFTAEGIQEFVQPGVTYDTYKDYISDFSMDTLK